MAPGGGFDQGRGQENSDFVAIADCEVQQMTESLNLTEEQQAKLREIMIQNSEDILKMYENMQEDSEMNNGREQMRLFGKQRDAKIKSVLTDVQWEKYQAQ